MVPVPALPPAVPFTSQVMPVLVVPVTPAWNCCVWPRSRLVLVGCTVTLILGGGGGGELPEDPQLLVSATRHITATEVRRRHPRCADADGTPSDNRGKSDAPH